ncbi:MAG: LysR family transcriptional regulator [Alphaproteobacteria bacterium HGW-Alphaproteobacteria-2]|nr:MAG: LysR family transcriptional regulator [Alphaproteobacteria bacterium HGW-Alphaproteobacteria-2]
MAQPLKLSHVDIRLLRVFATVVDCGGFAPAQVALNVSQSTISVHMTALETRLDMRLCERGRSGFRVTPEGRRVYEATQSLFRAIDSFGSEVEALRGRLTGELHIGCVDSVVTNPDFALPRALARFEARHGAVEVSLHIATPAEIERAVIEGRFHIGIGGYTQRLAALDYRPLIPEAQRLYAARDHPLAALPPPGPAPGDLGRYKFARRSYVPESAIPYAEHLNTSAQAENMEATAMLILSGAYIGFLPEHFARAWTHQGAMVSILSELMRFDSMLELITRKTVPQTPAAAYFRADLLDAFGITGAA